MTITTVLAGYAALVATLALAISLLLLRSLSAQSEPGQSEPAQSGPGQSGPGQSEPFPARAPVSLPPSGPGLGSPAPPIRARTSAGAMLDTGELAGRGYLVAFLSGSCRACRASLPVLIDYAVRFADPQCLIAVLVGEREQAADLERRLAGLATVVGGPAAGPIAAAYRITGFPSYLQVGEDGTVLAAGYSVLDLPQPQPQ